MAWTTPKTWTSEPLLATDLNTYVRDNQNYLKGKVEGTAKQYIRTATNYTTTGTSLADVDGTNMALTLTTLGGDVEVTFTAMASNGTGGASTTFGVKVDSTDYELVALGAGTFNPSFKYIFTGLSAGSHTFTLRWKVSAGTGTITAGTTLFDVREIVGVVA